MENIDRIILKRRKGGSGGADWNQNDPTAPDYVKNRTHYAEVNEDGAEVIHKLDAKYMPEPDMVITLSCPVHSDSISTNDVTVTSGTVAEVSSKILVGELVDVRVRGFENVNGYMADADEVKAFVMYYGGSLFVRWISPDSVGSSIKSYQIVLGENGNVEEVNRYVFSHIG